MRMSAKIKKGLLTYDPMREGMEEGNKSIRDEGDYGRGRAGGGRVANTTVMTRAVRMAGPFLVNMKRESNYGTHWEQKTEVS